jgi:hypothetical protein
LIDIGIQFLTRFGRLHYRPRYIREKANWTSAMAAMKTPSRPMEASIWTAIGQFARRMRIADCGNAQCVVVGE